MQMYIKCFCLSAESVIIPRSLVVMNSQIDVISYLRSINKTIDLDR